MSLPPVRSHRRASTMTHSSLSRREALLRLGGGLGGLALSALLAEGAGHDVKARKPHFAPKAKAVISLFMHGGPSHVNLLDPKPMLKKYDGKPPPSEVADDEKITGNLLGSPFTFHKRGQSGLEMSETLPGIGKHADKIAVIRSM